MRSLTLRVYIPVRVATENLSMFTVSPWLLYKRLEIADFTKLEYYKTKLFTTYVSFTPKFISSLCYRNRYYIVLNYARPSLNTHLCLVRVDLTDSSIFILN